MWAPGDLLAYTHTTRPPLRGRLTIGELVREADALGMAGVMIKAHYGSTSTRAALVNLISGCRCQAYGGPGTQLAHRGP